VHFLPLFLQVQACSSSTAYLSPPIHIYVLLCSMRFSSYSSLYAHSSLPSPFLQPSTPLHSKCNLMQTSMRTYHPYFMALFQSIVKLCLLAPKKKRACPCVISGRALHNEHEPFASQTQASCMRNEHTLSCDHEHLHSQRMCFPPFT
jgi:hypothetical protein